MIDHSTIEIPVQGRQNDHASFFIIGALYHQDNKLASTVERYSVMPRKYI
jgi:hypothetical protein